MHIHNGDGMSEEFFNTKRVTVPGLDEKLNEPIQVLNHGFVRLIDYMGDDSAIVQAARVSYGKGTKTVNQDAGLIKYLMRHKHTTPFEMCEIKLHIKLPIFVARQWLRHRTASVNEYSARYSILDSEFYIPEKDKIALQSSTNNQGRGDTMSEQEATEIIDSMTHDASHCYKTYEDFLAKDLTRELARINTTLNIYTQFYWKINLHNLLHFLNLRADKHSQYEIRVYAEAILELVKLWVPMTYNAFVEYAMESVNLSKSALSLVKKMLNNENVSREESGMSKREWDEIQDILK